MDNLRASPFLLQYIQESIPDYRSAIIIARHPGAVKRAASYAERLRIGFAVLHGIHKESESDEVDGRSSPPPSKARSFSIDEAMKTFRDKCPITVVGDVCGRIAIMIDDVIDDFASFVTAAEALRENGASKIYLLATHGLLNSNVTNIIEESPIDEVVITNTGN